MSVDDGLPKKGAGSEGGSKEVRKGVVARVARGWLRREWGQWWRGGVGGRGCQLWLSRCLEEEGRKEEGRSPSLHPPS